MGRPRAPSAAALEVRLPFLHEGGDPFASILGREGVQEPLFLVDESLGKRQLVGGADRILGEPEGDRAPAGHAARELQRAAEVFALVDEDVDITDAVRLFGFEEVTGEADDRCPAAANQSRESLGASSAGNKSDADLSLADTGCAVCNADIAGQCQLGTPSDTEAVDRADDRFGEVRDRFVDPAMSVDVPLFLGRTRGKLRDVGPSDKGFFPGAVDDHRSNVFVLFEFIERFAQDSTDFGVQRIEFVWAVEGNDGDVVIAFLYLDRCVGHRDSVWSNDCGDPLRKVVIQSLDSTLPEREAIDGRRYDRQASLTRQPRRPHLSDSRTGSGRSYHE